MMSNEDSKTRLLNILKWLETHHEDKSKVNSIASDGGKLSNQVKPASGADILRQNMVILQGKSPFQDNVSTIGTNNPNLNKPAPPSPENVDLDEKKLNGNNSYDYNIIKEMDESSAASKYSTQNNGDLALENSDIQTTNAFDTSNENNMSNDIPINTDRMKINPIKMSNIQPDEDAGNGDIGGGNNGCSNSYTGEETTTLVSIKRKIKDVPSEPPDLNEGLCKIQSAVSKQSARKTDCKVFEKNSEFESSSPNQSQKLVKSDEKISVNQPDSSKEMSDCTNSSPVRTEDNNCSLTPTKSTSKGLIKSLSTEDKIDVLGSHQPIVQFPNSTIPEVDSKSPSLNFNDNQKTDINSQDTNSKNLEEDFERDSHSVNIPLSACNPSASNNKDQPQQATLLSGCSQSKDSIKESDALAASTNSTGQNKAKEKKLANSGSVIQNLVKTGEIYTNMKIPTKSLTKSSVANTKRQIQIESNILKPDNQICETYKSTDASTCHSFYDTNQFGYTLMIPSNKYPLHTPEQYRTETPISYDTNIPMSKSSGTQYVCNPHSVNSESSMPYYSSQFQSGTGNDIIETNEKIVIPTNIFNNYVNNLKSFHSPYTFYLPKTSPRKSLIENTKPDIQGLIETCQSPPNYNVSNIPKNQYTLLQNALLRSPQQKFQQQCYPYIYKDSKSDDFVSNSKTFVRNSDYFKQFSSAQDSNYHINSHIMEYNNFHNPDICQTKSPTNTFYGRYPVASDCHQIKSFSVSNHRNTDEISPSPHRSPESFRQNHINKRVESNTNPHVENNSYNKTDGYSKDNDIDESGDKVSPKSYNYLPFPSTMNNTSGSFLSMEINSNNMLPSLYPHHYNSVLQPDSVKHMMPRFKTLQTNSSCETPKSTSKVFGDSPKTSHQFHQQSLSTLSAGELNVNKYSSEDQFVQNKMYGHNLHLLSHNADYQQNPTSHFRTQDASSIFERKPNTGFTKTNEYHSKEIHTSKQNDNIHSSNTRFPFQATTSNSGNSCFISEYPHSLHGHIEEDFQNMSINNCRPNFARNSELPEFNFADNYLGVDLVEESKDLPAPGNDSSKSGQTSEIMGDEPLFFSEYDPVFLASLLTNDLDCYPDYNSAFDDKLDDAAYLTLPNPVQTENDYIENVVSNFEKSLKKLDNNFISFHHSENNQHIDMFSAQNFSGMSGCMLPLHIQEGNDTTSSYNNQQVYSKHYNSDCVSSENKSNNVQEDSISHGGSIKQRYPHKSVTYQCAPGHTIYAADMVPRIDINPQVSKKLNASAAGIMRTSTTPLEKKNYFSYDQDAAKRFSDRCASKTAYQLAESISENEINRGRFGRKSSKRNDVSPYSSGSPTETSSANVVVNPGLGSNPATTTANKAKGKCKNIKEGPRRPRGRPRLSEEVKRERALQRALQAKLTAKNRNKQVTKTAVKALEESKQIVNTKADCDLNCSNDSLIKDLPSNAAPQIQPVINIIHDELSRNNDKEQSNKDNPNETEATVSDDNLVAMQPSKLEKEEIHGKDAEFTTNEPNEHGWVDEFSHLSHEEQQMKSYIELKKKLNKRQKTKNASWKCPYALSKSTNDKSFRNIFQKKRKCIYRGSLKKWHSSKYGAPSQKEIIPKSNRGRQKTLNAANNLSVENKMRPKDDRRDSSRDCSDLNADASERAYSQNILKPAINLQGKNKSSFMHDRKPKMSLLKKRKNRMSRDKCKNKISSPISRIQPCTPLPIYPPSPPPFFKLPPPPPLREKKVNIRNITPTILQNARLCYEAIKHQLSKPESDFDSFLISYANIGQGLQNCGAERYHRIKEILLKTYETKMVTNGKTSAESKKTNANTSAGVKSAEDTDNMINKNNAEMSLSDIEAISIQGDPHAEENPVDRDEFAKDYTELIKIILTSRTDEYRNIKLMISRNICVGSDTKQPANKHANQAEVEAKKAKLAAYFESVGKKIRMEEENLLKTSGKLRGAPKKQRRKRSTEEYHTYKKIRKDSKLLANAHDIKTPEMCPKIVQNMQNSDSKENSSGAYIVKKYEKKSIVGMRKQNKNPVGRPRKHSIKESVNIISNQCYKREKRYGDGVETSSSDDGFVEESTGDCILGLGTDSEDDIFFNSVNFHTNIPETNSGSYRESEKNHSKESLNSATSIHGISKQYGLRENLPTQIEDLANMQPKEKRCHRESISPVNVNSKVSSHLSASKLNNVTGRKECSLLIVDKGNINKEPSTTEHISSFKLRNKSKIIKPKTAVIKPKENRLKRLCKIPQNISRLSKSRASEDTYSDEIITDNHPIGNSNTEVGKNATNLAVIAETKRSVTNLYPTEKCVENMDALFVDSDIEMSETLHIAPDEDLKIRNAINKEYQKQGKSSFLKSNSIIRKKSLNSIKSHSLLSQTDGKSSFPERILFRYAIPQINKLMSGDAGDDDGEDNDYDEYDNDDEEIKKNVGNGDNLCKLEEDINMKPISFGDQEKVNDQGASNFDSPTSPDITEGPFFAESNIYWKKCLENPRMSHIVAGKRVPKHHLSSIRKSSSKTSNSRVSHEENTEEVTNYKFKTDSLNLSETESMTFYKIMSSHKNMTDDRQISSPVRDFINKFTDATKTKNCRLKSKEIIKEHNNGKTKKVEEILKIHAINFEEEPVLLKTTKVLKEEKCYKAIREKKKLYDVLFKKTSSGDNGTVSNDQNEFKDETRTCNVNTRDIAFGQYSGSNVNLLKIWDSKSSKLPILSKHFKNSGLKCEDGTIRAVMNNTSTEGKSRYSHTRKSTERINRTTDYDKKTKQNSLVKRKLTDTSALPKGKEQGKRKCNYLFEKDKKEKTPRKTMKLKINRIESSYKRKSLHKNNLYVKASESIGNSSKRLDVDINSGITYKNCIIENSKSTEQITTAYKNTLSNKDTICIENNKPNAVEKSSKTNKKDAATKTSIPSNLNQPSRRKKKHTLHACEYCCKEFKKPSLLLYHTRTHTGERPFKCDVCKKAFVSNSHLLRHSRTHSGKGFSQSPVEGP